MADLEMMKIETVTPVLQAGGVYKFVVSFWPPTVYPFATLSADELFSFSKFQRTVSEQLKEEYILPGHWSTELEREQAWGREIEEALRQGLKPKDESPPWEEEE